MYLFCTMAYSIIDLMVCLINLREKGEGFMRTWSRGKKIMLLVLIVLISVIVILYNLFNGNFIGRAITKSRITKYIEKTYPNKDFEVYDVFFDFKFGRYSAKVQSKEEGLDFCIEDWKNGRVYDEYKESSYLEDLDLERRFSKTVSEELERELKDILSLDINNPKGDFLFVDIIVKQGKYRDRTIKYNKDMDDFMSIEISVKDKEKAILVAKRMKEILREKNYNGLKVFSVNYFENDIPYFIALESEDLNSNKSVEEFLKKGIVTFHRDTGLVRYESEVSSKKEEIEIYEKDLKE